PLARTPSRCLQGIRRGKRLMTAFLIRRLLSVIPVLLGVSIIVFTMQKLLPGDAATAMLGATATAEEIESLRKAMGLDLPIYEQYFRWASAVVQGDFGRSIALKVPVYDAILPKFANTLVLASFSLALSVCLGTVLGSLAGVRPNSRLDRGITFFAVL